METVIVWIMVAFIGLTFGLVMRRDWPRLQRIGRTVTGEVTGYRSYMHDNVRSFAPIYRFHAEGAEHEVVDQVYSGTESTPLGTRVTLAYPVGRPDLARPPRPLLWLFVYGFLIVSLGLLIAKLLGVLPD